MTEFTYVVTHLTGGTTVITNDVESIELTDVGTGEIKSAKITLNALNGKFLTTAPVLAQFDQIKVKITDDSSNNYEVSKFINTTKNIDISDLYQTVFPDMHSFYFFEKKTKDEHTDNIIIFDNHKGIRTPEYFTIKDELILNSTNEPLDNVLNVFYSNKLNCLYNHIDLSKKELTSVIEKMHKEKYSESDGLIEHPNGNPEKSGKEEDVKFNGYKLFISFLILIYFCPPIFKWIIEKIVDKQWQEESIIFLAVILHLSISVTSRGKEKIF